MQGETDFNLNCDLDVVMYRTVHSPSLYVIMEFFTKALQWYGYMLFPIRTLYGALCVSFRVCEFSFQETQSHERISHRSVSELRFLPMSCVKYVRKSLHACMCTYLEFSYSCWVTQSVLTDNKI